MGLFYVLVPLVAFSLNFILAFLVLRQNLSRRVNKVFSVFLISMALWVLAIYVMRSSHLENALIWEKVVFAVLPLVSVSFFHFVHLFTEQKLSFRLGLVLYLSILGSVCLIPTDLLVNSMQPMWYGHGFEPGPLMTPYMLIYYGIVVWALFILVRAYRRSSSIMDRARYVYVAAGAAACVIGLLMDVLASRGVQIYPMGIYGNIIFSFLCAYAMLRYRLLDVPLIIRKGAAYILVSAFGIGIYLGILIVAYVFISGVWSLPIWLNAVLIFLIAIGLQPTLSWVQNLVDRWFYRGRFDYLNALVKLAEETRTITDLEYVADVLVNTISNAMRSLDVYVLLPDMEDKYFISVFGRNFGASEQIRLNKEDTLIWWLSHNKNILLNRDIEALPLLKALTIRDRFVLDKTSANLIIPLLTRDGLRGILILGKKLSEQEYSNEEISMLRLVANQMANIIDNARLYELQNRRYKEQTLLARLSMTIASELDFGKVYSSLMKEIEGIMPLNYGAVMLLNEKSGKALNVLEYKLIPNLKTEASEAFFTKESLSELGTSEFIYEADLLGDPSSQKYSALLQIGVRSVLLMPLRSKESVMGYFALASLEADAYNEDYIRLLKQVVINLGIAYEKSRLYTLEKQMRQELEKQDKERTEFINSLIHEIKTPITAMLASGDLLNEELSGTPGVLGELAENLSTSVNNLNKRVSELTDFAKLQSTEIKIVYQQTDMNELAERAAVMVSGLLRSRNQELKCELEAVNHVLKADPDRIIQVLLNLLTNASKYGRPYNDIRLKVYNQDSYLITEVHDSATPLQAEDREALFRPYNLARKKESGGLGLGLFICKRLVELHGGKIWLETDVTGNKFKFSLPLELKVETNN